MKLKVLVASIITVCAFNGFAQDYIQHTAMNNDLYPWSLGTDLRYMYYKPTVDYRPLLDQNKIGGTIYLAYRPGKTFDYELGFAWTTRDVHTLVVQPGDRVIGVTAQDANTYYSRVRFEDTYFDIHANLPMTKFVELKLGAGLGVVRQKFRITTHTSHDTDPLQHALARLQGKSTFTGRLIIGMQSLLFKRVGLRLMYNYETYQNIRIRNSAGANRKLMGNAYTVLLGAFWIFNGD